MDESKKVKRCPRCDNEQISRDATYCIICGLSLFNLCEGDEIFDNYRNADGKGQQHENLSNARFCEKCGSRTLFFKEGFLSPYDDVREQFAESMKYNIEASLGNALLEIGIDPRALFDVDDDELQF